MARESTMNQVRDLLLTSARGNKWRIIVSWYGMVPYNRSINEVREKHGRRGCNSGIS